MGLCEERRTITGALVDLSILFSSRLSLNYRREANGLLLIDFVIICTEISLTPMALRVTFRLHSLLMFS